MHIRETASGDYAIRQVPVMHWCVIALLVGISAVGYVNDAPLWIRIILCLIILVMLIRNSSFSMTTAFYPSQQKIHTQHRKLFGLKERTVDFSAVGKVDFELEHWGRHRRTPRANLTLWTLDEDRDDDLIEVFVMANPDEGQRVAERVNQLLEPFMAPPAPEAALVPTWLDERAITLLDRLCREQSSESCFFVPNADLSESRSKTIYEEMSLPADEYIIAFVDFTDQKEGKRGLAICRGGLYWKNTFFTASKSTWIGWDAFVDAAVSSDPNDSDVWIEPSMQIGLGDAARQKPMHDLLLNIQRVLRTVRDAQE
ncbi:MAG: hypothetical protein ACPGRY_06865 [Candidatus Latescibacterota bacterium]